MTKKKILIVDDVEDIRYLLKTILELENYAVGIAETGKDALVKIQQEKPELIILDIMMPDMDGWTVCERLKEMKMKIPIMILTAKSDDASREKSKRYEQIKGFVTKPFLNEDFLKQVKRAVK